MASGRSASTTALGIEFDIFDNPGANSEPTTDHTNIFDTDDLTSDPR